MKTKRLLSLLVAMTMVFSLFSAFTITTEAASMADATFFAKLDYSIPGLSAVKAAVDKKDYTTAKKALLEYYKKRKASGEDLGFGISEADENYGMAVLPMRNILTGPYEFDMWQGEFTVTSSDYTAYTVDVTDRVAQELNNGAVSFMLMAGDKQQYPVYVKSKEAGAAVAPKLIVNGIEIDADNDTYISSGSKSAINGSATELTIKEDGSGSDPTGSDTRRAFINFSLGAVADTEIKSAELKLNAAYAADCTTGDKTVLVINIGDTVWYESTLNWNLVSGTIYSYQDAANPTWGANITSPVNSEYHNVTSRFWFGRPMAYEYLSWYNDNDGYDESHPYSDAYPGEEFGPKLVELMNAFATQRGYGYTRTLETGERLNRWVDIVDAFLATDVFDGREDMFVNILSFMWGDCNYLSGLDIASDGPWWSNWKIVANAGFFKATEFLYEFKDHDAFREKVEYNVEWTMDYLYNDDMSFSEAGPSYGLWCAQLFGDCAIAAEKAGNPMSAVFIEKLRYVTLDAMNSFFPDGYDSNVGDSNYRDKMPEFKRLAELLKDDVLNAYVSGDGSYTEGLTSFSDTVNSAYMRTSWDPKETTYLSFVNNPSGGHAHPDSNQVLMYAYGHPLLVDSGRYSYTNSNDIYGKLRWAQAHNTVDAEGVDMASDKNYHSGAEKFSVWADNALFNFGTSGQHGYPGITHTRNVLFLKDAGFAVVTDYVDGNNANQKYNQNWHFMPSSNAVAVGDHNIETNFYKKANVILANADADATATVENGYFSADYGLVAASKYGSFSKTGADVKFGTVLYPVKEDESATVTAKDIAADINSSAIEFTVNGKTSTLYVKNTDAADGKFGDYTSDASLGFVTDDAVALVNGTTLTGGAIEIKSPLQISDISVSVDGDTLIVSGDNLMATTDETVAAAIKADGVTTVILNGEEVATAPGADGAILAVGVASVVTTEEVKIVADKDGFVKQDGTNEGIADEKNRSQIQAAISGWAARNAYAAFDLSNYSADDIEKAVLRMTVTEAASGGKVHFYYLDYGDWTRDSLKFVLDSSKMPTNTNDNSDPKEPKGLQGFTGYSWHTEASVSGVPVGGVFEADLTNNLKGYLNGGGSKKFTLAMLSEAGSTKFASITNTYADFKDSDGNPYPGPTIVLTTKNVTGETVDTTVTVKFVDEKGNELKPSETVTDVKEGNFYSYEAPEMITVDGKVYALDSKASTLGTMIKKGKNELTAVYTEAAKIDIVYTDNGETVKSEEPIYVVPGTSYTFTPEKLYIIDDQYYLVDTDYSTFTVRAQQGVENKIEIVLAKAYLGEENLIENGGFETDLNGWYSVGANNSVIANKYGERSTAQKHSGEASYLQKEGNSGTSEKNIYGQFSLGEDVEAGKNYLLSFWRYGGGADGVTLTVGLNGNYHEVNVDESCGGLGNTGDSNPSCNLTGLPTNEWHQLSYVLTANELSKYAVVFARWNGGQYYDDFELREISSDILPVDVTVKYVNEDDEDILSSKTFKKRIGEEYDASDYVINTLYGNQKIRTFDKDATGELTGRVGKNTVIELKYNEESYDGIVLDLSFDDKENGFEGGLGKANAQGDIVLEDGVKGKALYLDGTGSNWLSAVMAEDGSPLLANMEEITITYYNNSNSTNGAKWPFFAADSANAQGYGSEHYLGALIDKDNNFTIERYSNSGGRDSANNVGTTITAGAWSFVSVVVSKDKTEIYIDGKKVAEKAAKNSLLDVLGQNPVFQIGKANWGDGEYHNGLIDEFKIYDRALTADEVAALAGKAIDVSLGWDDAKESFTIDFLFGGTSLTVYKEDGRTFKGEVLEGEKGIAFFTDDTNARYQAKAVIGTVESAATEVVSIYSLVTKAIADFAVENKDTEIRQDQLDKAIEVLNNGGIYLIGGKLTPEADQLMELKEDGNDLVINIRTEVAATGIKFNEDSFNGFASDKNKEIQVEFEVTDEGKSIILYGGAVSLTDTVIYLEDIEFVLEIGDESVADEIVSGELDFVEEV